jgi:hypothetical protein
MMTIVAQLLWLEQPNLADRLSIHRYYGAFLRGLSEQEVVIMAGTSMSISGELGCTIIYSNTNACCLISGKFLDSPYIMPCT